LDTFSDVRNRVSLTSSHVSGERYERKILKKIQFLSVKFIIPVVLKQCAARFIGERRKKQKKKLKERKKKKEKERKEREKKKREVALVD